MKPHDILLQTLSLLQQENLGTKVCLTFPEEPAQNSIKDPIIILDLKSGAEDAVYISLCLFTPTNLGAESCRELANSVRETLLQDKILGYQYMVEKEVCYDSKVCAYKKEATAIFKGELLNITVTFGDETIAARKGTRLLAKRRVVDYFSPMAGDITQDLGKYLKEIKGSAYIGNEQFLRLNALVESGEVLQASIGGVTFTGILTELCGNGCINDETSFTIKEASE